MKSDSELLLHRAHKSLEAARLLSERGYPEIAASRAYYAMFYAAQAILEDRGFSFSRHAAVVAAFGKEITHKGILDRKLHRYLIDAQALRDLADYRIRSTLTAEQVQGVLIWAEEFLEVERALRGYPPACTPKSEPMR